MEIELSDSSESDEEIHKSENVFNLVENKPETRVKLIGKPQKFMFKLHRRIKIKKESKIKCKNDKKKPQSAAKVSMKYEII